MADGTSLLTTADRAQLDSIRDLLIANATAGWIEAGMNEQQQAEALQTALDIYKRHIIDERRRHSRKRVNTS